MIPALVAALLAVQAAAGPDPREIEHAIEADRLEQARQMLAEAMAAGQSGVEIDRLAADLAFAKEKWATAQVSYAALLHANPNDERSAVRAAIASLMLGDSVKAAAFVDAAIALNSSSWEAWNAKGVLCDLGRDWTCADEAFAKARGITVIVDGSQVPVVYAADSIDVTKAFIADFNSKNPATASVTQP